jgi:hypothetical protein
MSGGLVLLSATLLKILSLWFHVEDMNVNSNHNIGRLSGRRDCSKRIHVDVMGRRKFTLFYTKRTIAECHVSKAPSSEGP